jgi:hypothetical protein
VFNVIALFSFGNCFVSTKDSTTMFRWGLHNNSYGRNIIDLRAGCARFTQSGGGPSELSLDKVSEAFSKKYGTKGLAVFGATLFATLSLAVYVGTYTLRRDMNSRFNAMDSRFIEIKQILLDQKLWLAEQVEKQNAQIHNQNKEIVKQGALINKHYEKVLPLLVASSLRKEQEEKSHNWD